jgi:hypothetical protein
MNKNPKVDTYMEELENTMKELLEENREIIFEVDAKMEEDIKWGAPTFLHKSNFATFNPRSKKCVNLTFYTGAMIEDPHGVLPGDPKEARAFRAANTNKLSERKAELEDVVRNWIQ